MLGNRDKLRFLYLALCASQLVIMGLGLAVARQIQKSYASDIENEKSVNAEREVISQLEALARAASPGMLAFDNISVPNQLSQIDYAAKAFLRNAQDLVSKSESDANSPEAHSRASLRALVEEMGMLQQQSQLARAAWAQNDAALVQARLTYMDRHVSEVQTLLGDINLELSRTKESVLLRESTEARRAGNLLRPLSILGIVLLFPALLYAWRLDRDTRDYENQLESERSLLEKRVASRTFELQTEIDTRTRMEAFNNSRNRLMEKVAGGRDLDEVVTELVLATEQSMAGSRCLVVFNGGQSRSAIAPNLSSDLAARIGRILLDRWNSVPLERVGDAMFLQVVDPNNRIALAEAWSRGFRGILAVPITEPERPILGLIALLLKEPSDPGLFARDVLLSASRLSSVALEHDRMQGELFRRAHYDPLTNLPNRGLLEDRLQQAIALADRSKTSVGVLCIDLDGFKQVNDYHGHQAGDWLLEQVAGRLTSHLRKSDTIARLGGDEFVAVIHDARQGSGVATFCESLVRLIAQPYSLADITLRVTASIGASVYPGDSSSCAELQRHADMAMYRAKERGNTYEVFSADLGEKLARQKEIEGHVQDALERDEFTLYYQPIYSMARTLVGLEALIRFRRPELEPISPAEFVPVAERTGQVTRIGEWVLREACRQVKQWQKDGLTSVPVAVNVSAIQLARADFAELVGRTLREADLAPEWLHVEITETAVMSDFEEGRHQVEALAKMGVQIAIDDFGTGHSSLNYIHRLPITALKIDRSFVRAMMEAQGSRVIVRAIIAMSQSLGLSVIAEGVETEEQMSTLSQAGCDLAQGYLLGKPLHSSSVTALLVGLMTSAVDTGCPTAIS